MIFDSIEISRPELLDFTTKPSKAEVDSWCKLHGTKLHQSLREVWERYGTGTVFETEEFYSAASDPDTGESASSINQCLWDRGLRKDRIVFHSGLGGFTCMDGEGAVTQLREDDLAEEGSFESLECWFDKVLLTEYAERYSLKNILESEK